MIAAASSAQAPPPPLPPTREEITPPAPPSTPQQRRLEVEGGIPAAPCALGGPEFQSIHFVLTGAAFDGLEGVTSAQLAPAYAAYLNRDVPIATVCAIRDRASAILRDAGYIAAVQVPEQRISSGNVRFKVVMAHLTQVRVRGDASGAEAVLAGYLNQLTREPLFNRFEAERYLLLASDLPGYTVRLTLRPTGMVPGEVIGDVTVQRQPAYVDFVLQNGGSHALGPWGALLRAQVFGLTGLADRTAVSIYTTPDLKEQQTIQLVHDMRLGDQGLSLSGSFTYAWAKPTIVGADVLARTLLANAELGYPFVRRQAKTVRGALGMDVINQRVEVDGPPVSRDRLRVAYGRLGIDMVGTHFPDSSYSAALPPWHLFAQMELRQGVDAFGATYCPLATSCGLPTSRPAGHPDAAVVRWLINGEVRPSSRFTMALNLRAQYAWKPLLSFRGVRGGQLHGRARLRSGSPARRPRLGQPGRAALRQPHSRHQEGGCGRLRLLGPRRHPQSRHRSRRTRHTPQLGRRRRKGELRPVRPQRRAGRSDEPCRAVLREAGSAVAHQHHHPAVSVAILGSEGRMKTAIAIAAAASAVLAATPSFAVTPLSIRDSWRIGSSGTSFCSAQSLTTDKAFGNMFDSAYSVTCRDAALPVGKLYKLKNVANAQARVDADRADRATCQQPGAAKSRASAPSTCTSAA